MHTFEHLQDQLESWCNRCTVYTALDG